MTSAAKLHEAGAPDTLMYGTLLSQAFLSDSHHRRWGKGFAVAHLAIYEGDGNELLGLRLAHVQARAHRASLLDEVQQRLQVIERLGSLRSPTPIIPSAPQPVTTAVHKTSSHRRRSR